MAKKLFRNRDQRKIAGICGGLGEYFDIDPTIIRLLWIGMVLGLGTGILLYIIAWIVVPEEPLVKVAQQPHGA